MRREFPKKVQREARLRANSKCEGVGCGCTLTIGKFAYDHRIPDWMGGEPVLSNCQVLCAPCHKEKTRARREGSGRSSAPRGCPPRHPDRAAPADP